MKITETEANMYTVAEAAALLHMKERDFRGRFRELGIPSVRVGYRILIPIKRFEKWLREEGHDGIDQGHADQRAVSGSDPANPD